MRKLYFDSVRTAMRKSSIRFKTGQTKFKSHQPTFDFSAHTQLNTRHNFTSSSHSHERPHRPHAAAAHAPPRLPQPNEGDRGGVCVWKRKEGEVCLLNLISIQIHVNRTPPLTRTSTSTHRKRSGCLWHTAAASLTNSSRPWVCRNRPRKSSRNSNKSRQSRVHFF